MKRPTFSSNSTDWFAWIDHIEAENEALKADQRRLEWLVNESISDYDYLPLEENWREAIDVEMSREKGNE